MKTLLLIDDDPHARAAAVEAFASDPEFSVVSVATYEEALWGLEEYPVALALVALGLPERQGFQLLTYLANCYPELPVMVMSEPWEPRDELPVLPWVGHLRKPVRPQALGSRVRGYLEGLQRRARHSLSLQDFLQILALERETCRLSVRGGTQGGEFHLFQGEIVHAACGALEGEGAIHEMLGWEDVWLSLHPVPAELRLTLTTQLSKMLVEVEPALNEGNPEPLPQLGGAAGAKAPRPLPPRGPPPPAWSSRKRREGVLRRAVSWAERWLLGLRVGVPDRPISR